MESSRRRRSLSDEKIGSLNLRDFLRVKDDDDDDDRRVSLAGLTLGAILDGDKRASSPQVNRTLLDIIREDPNGGGFRDGKKSWKSFTDKLRLRRAGAAWTSTVHIPASDLAINHNNSNRVISRRNSTPFSDDPTPESTRPELSSSSSSVTINVSDTSNRSMMLHRNSSRIPSLASTREGRLDHSINSSDNNVAVELPDLHRRVQFTVEEDTEEGVGETTAADEDGEGGGEEPVRMSLMALLAETEREMGIDGSAYMMDDEEEGEEEEEEEEVVEESVGVGVEGEYNNCCVCMVRHKGSAFIPCGHTFCRLCSRELWVQRGNCPLCNGFILEILDIF